MVSSSLKEDRTFELVKTAKISEGFFMMCYITCMLTVEMTNSLTLNNTCKATSSVGLWQQKHKDHLIIKQTFRSKVIIHFS